MKFLELNKKRHAIKHFTDQPVDPKRAGLPLRSQPWPLSAHNSQPWKFWSFSQKNAELAKLAYGANYDQVMEAPADHRPLYRYWFVKTGSQDCACWWGEKLHRRAIAIPYAKSSCWICALWCPTNKWLLGFECRSCGYELGTCFDGPGIGTNIILGFDKSKSMKYWTSKSVSVQKSWLRLATRLKK